VWADGLVDNPPSCTVAVGRPANTLAQVFDWLILTLPYHLARSQLEIGNEKLRAMSDEEN
ncbi:MAG TPA: hypothetical protein PLU88_11695, partial [Armatimonadota bacterium]|nr:hypothetical protein [Armatimonadota bacterium]